MYVTHLVMLNTFIEWLRRKKNRVRIWWAKHVRGTVRDIHITDRSGKKHTVTAEQTEEKICAHVLLRQVNHILWKCNNKECEINAYFFITSKVLASEPELLAFMHETAKALDLLVHEKDECKPVQYGNGKA